VAVASAGPYASLHLASDRYPCQHPTAQGWMLFLPTNQQRRSTEGLIGMQNKLKSFTGMSSNWLWTVNGIVSLSRHSVIVVRAHGTGLIILKQKKQSTL